MSNYKYQERIYRNLYEDYLDVVHSGIEQGHTRTQIFRDMQEQGFRGKYSAFLNWIKCRFPGLKASDKASMSIANSAIQKAQTRFYRLTPKRMAIHLCNPEYGICKKSGEIGLDTLISEEIIIANAKTLPVLRDVSVEFRNIMRGDGSSSNTLSQWIDRALRCGFDAISSFAAGIRKFQDEVENAIKYRWTNGVTEGNVNRLKVKKREMYGRASFELLRRKVCLSVTG